jgi:DNA-binding transcriptional LysR family regulator
MLNWHSMEIEDLKYFYAVVTEGNFTKASRALRIAQPAISRRIKRLEEDLGSPLLIRHKRHVELTPTGNAVLRYTNNIFENVEHILTLSKHAITELEGPINIAAGDSIATFFLPRWLATFTDAHRKTLPLVNVGPSESLLKKIQSGSIDLGIFFYVPEIQGSRLKIEALIKVPHRFVVRKKSSKDENVMSAFIGSREVDSTSNISYPTLDKLRKVYPSAHIQFSSNNLALHKQLVLLGKGVAILPEFLVASELNQKKLLDVLPKEKFSFELKLVTHPTRPTRPAASKFIEWVRSQL